MDKTVETKKNGEYEKSKSRSLFITDLEEMEVETMLQIRAAHWNIEMQHWILDIQLREDRQTARRNDAVTNGAILRRFCMAMKKKDKTLSDKPLNRFLMSNAHNPLRVEEFLFGTVAGEE